MKGLGRGRALTPSQMLNLGWVSGHAIIFAHIMSLRYYHRTGCGSLSLKKMWSLEYFKIWQRDLEKSIYICYKSAFNLFEDIVLRIELPERSDACVRDVAHMLVQYHHTSVTFCHICHGLMSHSGVWMGAKCPGKCRMAWSVLYTHCEYPGMARKFNIGVFFYVVIIPYFLRLNWNIEGCKTRVLGIMYMATWLLWACLFPSKKIRASCLLSLCNY